MKLIKTLLLFALMFTLLNSPTRCAAAPLFFEGFESRQLGALDQDLAGGPNFGTNGDLTGNPWWGPFPPNIQVVGAENGITPHSGTNMARGVGFTGPADFDQDYFNLGYRLNNTNGGFGFTGNYFLDWWFYDAVGQGTNGSATNYCDYIALGNYGAVPINTDAPANDSAGNSVSQRMSIGATSNESAGYDSTKYQMRFIGIPGYNGGGW